MANTKKTVHQNKVKKQPKLSPEDEKRSLYANIKKIIHTQGTDETLDKKNERFNLLEYKLHNPKSENPSIGDLKPYEVTYPKVFYTELLRLLGLPHEDENLRRKPRILGRITNQIIYLRFPNGTLKELQTRNPITSNGIRIHKHFQFLTDIGEVHLLQFLDEAIKVMAESDNYGQFYQRLRKKIGKSWQLSLFDII